jgi:hypothetical protein
MSDGHITKTTVAMDEHCHLPVASETGPAYPRPNIATESSKFSPTSLFEMKIDDVKNSYYPQPTIVDRGREEFVNSVQFDGSW